MQRLSCRDPALKYIGLDGKHHADAELAELVDCLLAHPDVVTILNLARNQLTDKTGVKLAQYLASSTTLEWLNMRDNQFGEETYLALAAALRVNSSLRVLYLNNCRAVDRTRIDQTLVDALWFNPNRPAGSVWQLYSSDYFDIDFKRLKNAADQLGHPTLQLLLARLC